MIPKIIHYCWFGKNQKPNIFKKCYRSWKRFCDGFEIIEWNEDNFNINANQYIQDAYQSNKFAFVSDYARLYVLVKYGGVYLDTDLEVVKPIDDFLKYKAFSGFESSNYIPTAIMGCEKNFPLFNELLGYYDTAVFLDNNNKQLMKTNVLIITKIMEKYGLVKDGSFQIIRDFALFPQEFFCPFDDAKGILKKTDNTHTIHWFSKTWIERKYRIRSKITKKFHRFFGIKCFDFLKGSKKND